MFRAYARMVFAIFLFYCAGFVGLYTSWGLAFVMFGATYLAAFFVNLKVLSDDSFKPRDLMKGHEMRAQARFDRVMNNDIDFRMPGEKKSSSFMDSFRRRSGSPLDAVRAEVEMLERNKSKRMSRS